MRKINEDSRNDIINKSKRSDLYEPDNRAFGKNRHQRRLKSRISRSTEGYNEINMNKFFKDDIVDFTVRVNGETDMYSVRLSFGGILNSLAGFLPNDATEDDVDFRAVYRAVVDAFNHNDIYVNCSCEDFRYRSAYWCTVNGTNAGAPETRPSDITNPNDTKGYCKHINLVLSNTKWVMPLASVIRNYFFYFKEHYPQIYADILYPAVFDREYEEPVQLDMQNEIDGLADDELNSGRDLIDTANKWARTKNQFKKGNQSGIQFAPNDLDEPIAGQQKMFDIDSIDDIDEPTGKEPVADNSDEENDIDDSR